MPGFHSLKAGEDWLLARQHVGKAALSQTQAELGLLAEQRLGHPSRCFLKASTKIWAESIFFFTGISNIHRILVKATLALF